MTFWNNLVNFLGGGCNAFLELLIAAVVVILIVLAFRWRTEILQFWNEIYASWVGISKFGKHLILAASLAIVFGLFGFACGMFAKSQARTWLCEYDSEIYPDCPALMVASTTAVLATPTPTPQRSQPTPSPGRPAEQLSLALNASASPTATPTPTPEPAATPIPLTSEQKDRLEAQARTIKGLKRHHASVMAFFSQAYYTAICVLLVAGAVLAIAMFFIGTKGWGQTNQYVRTVFVVMAAMAAFYGLWPPVFQQEKNLSDNKALFLEYETLQNEISSYAVTRTNVKNESKTPNDFINYIDSEMARLGNVAIGFDYTKISYKGAFESNSSSTPTPSPSATKKPGT